MKLRGNHVDELISASLSGDLTDAERVELESHLARCETCRNTLAAFTAERRILLGLPLADPPRDLSARVRSGIESGRLAPWWRRPGRLVAVGASLATVAAAILAVVVFNNLDLGPPVGHQSGSPQASMSTAPSSSAIASIAPSLEPPAPPTFLGPGELGYLSLTGAPLEALRLTFINDATGASIDAGTVSGPPIAASLSPDGQWLAYITQKGETGANEVWTLNLTDGEVTHLGCSSAAPFTNRLTWSPDSRYLAYTLVGVDLGPDAGCQAASDGGDVWLFDSTTSEHTQFTTAGNAFAADFAANVGASGARLWVSFAMAAPQSALLAVPDGPGREADEQAPGVFLPTFSPDGSRAIFWNGTMTSNGGSWHFSVGGMPQLSGDFRSAGPASPWLGTALFTDLTPVGGEAFFSGDFAWGPDSNLFAFWDGAWPGIPESADGSYPNQQDVYVGRVSSGLLSSASALALVRPSDAYLVAIGFAPAGSVAVTLGLPSAGIGDPPSAFLQIVPLDGGSPQAVGGGSEAPPWNGPAVYGH